MKSLRSSLVLLIVIVATWWLTASTVAQTAIPNGVFVKSSEGFLWLVLDGQRVKIPVWAASDADIAALPEPDRWAVANDAGAIVAGDRPAWYVDAPAANAAVPAPAAGAPPADTTIPMQTAVVYDGWEVAVETASRETTLPKDQSATPQLAQPKGAFVVVRARVKNLGNTSAPAPRFVLVDSAGRRFDQDGFAGLYGSFKYKLPSAYITTVQPSVTDRVVIGFDIATDAQGIVLAPAKGPEPRPRWATGL